MGNLRAVVQAVVAEALVPLVVVVLAVMVYLTQ
jgi:hypothetical protein